MVSPLLHHHPMPSVIGGGNGRSRHYPAGRVCASPGCRTLLRRTNPGPFCDPCTESAKARERAEGDAMNKGLEERKFQVMAYLLDKEEWVTPAEYAVAHGLSVQQVRYALRKGQLRGRRVGPDGGRWRVLASEGRTR